MFANNFINIGEEILFVPFDCCIEAAQQPDLPIEIPDEVRLAYSIIKAHENKNSKWYHFIEFVHTQIKRT